MRWFRLVVGAALICLAAMAWQWRDPVVEAYTEDRPPAQIEFDGLDLRLTNRTEVGPSPLVVPTAPDTKAVSLAPIAVTVPLADEPDLPVGSMRLAGIVRNGAVPVPFATVRLEHHRVEESDGAPAVAVVDVLADELGQWSVAGVAGGRWRIRGFVPNVLGSTGTVVQFIAARESHSVDLSVAEPDGGLVLELVAAPSLELGQQGTVALTVGVRRIDAEGMVVIEPVADAAVAVTMGPGAVLRPLSPMTTATSASGSASFGFSCDVVGSSSATAAVNASVSVSRPGNTQESPADGDAELVAPQPTPAVVSVEQRAGSLSATLPVCEEPPPPPEPAPADDAPGAEVGTGNDGDVDG